MYDIVRVYCVKSCDCVYHIGNINGKLNNINYIKLMYNIMCDCNYYGLHACMTLYNNVKYVIIIIIMINSDYYVGIF